ncbi:hypothetical protein K7432_017451, partial [Basidiobolus ranarum]
MGMDDLYRFGKRGSDCNISHFSDAEKAWLNLWSSILRLSAEYIGRNDSFFSLGGDSIVAIKLVAAARERGYDITVQQVFENPTIAELAQQFNTVENEQLRNVVIEKYSLLGLNEDEVQTLLNGEIRQNGISPSDIEDVYPCTALQEALFAIGLRTQSDYLAQRVFVCGVDVDFERLKAAWISVIMANAILRTTIVFANSEKSHLNGLQVVLERNIIDWQEKNVGDGDDIKQVLANILEDDRKRGIETGRLLTRFTALRNGNGMSYFIWTIHHALYDGWSMDHMLNDLITAYQGQVVAIRPAYSHFINYNLQLSRSESIMYWSKVLNGVSKTFISKSTQLSKKAEAHKVITSQVHIDFSELTAKYDITLATIVNLAWAIVLKYHTGNSDVVFGTVNSGRSIPVNGIDQICGPCITTLPVRVNFENNLTLVEMMASMHADRLQQHRYQNIGLLEIQKECTNIVNANLFDSLLVVQNLGIVEMDSLVNSVGLIEVKTSMPPDYPLVIDISTSDDDLEISILFDECSISHHEVNWIMEHMKTTLGKIATNISTTVNDISIISDAEHRLLNKWGGETIEYAYQG